MSGGDDDPPRVVAQRHARHERERGHRIGPHPVPRRHHLRVEEQVPGRERGPAHQRDGRRALRQGAPDDQGGPRHHHPGERHDHRHARQLGAQRPRVARRARTARRCAGPAPRPRGRRRRPPRATPRRRGGRARAPRRPATPPRTRATDSIVTGRPRRRRHQRVDDLHQHGRAHQEPHRTGGRRAVAVQHGDRPTPLRQARTARPLLRWSTMTALRVLTAVGIARTGPGRSRAPAGQPAVPAGARGRARRRGRAGVGARARPRRGAPHHADRALAAGAARRRRPGDPRPGRRFHRRHRRRGARGGRGRPPPTGPDRHAPPAPAWLGQAARLRPARGRGPRPGAGVRRRRRRAGPRRRWRPRSRSCGAGGFDLLCPWPRQLADGLLPRLVQPLLVWSWSVLLPLRPAERSRTAVAGRGQRPVPPGRRRGARRRRAGSPPWRAPSSTTSRWPGRSSRSGGRTGIADGSRIAACRMYEDGRELVAGYAKSLWSAFGDARARRPSAALLTLVYLVPPLAALRGLPHRAGGYAAAHADPRRRRPAHPRAGVAGRARPPAVRRRAAGPARPLVVAGTGGRRSPGRVGRCGEPVVVVGAGVGGLAVAARLAAQGHAVELHERSSDPRRQAGRVPPRRLRASTPGRRC